MKRIKAVNKCIGGSKNKLQNTSIQATSNSKCMTEETSRTRTETVQSTNK
jgi:hypothetical protein